MITTPPRRLTLAIGAALAAAVLGLPGGAGAGCLAPSDALVDGAAVGPFWGNEGGFLVYSRDLTGSNATLVRRDPLGGRETLAEVGVRNEFFVGLDRETWAQFHAGTINSDGDVAFVAVSGAGAVVRAFDRGADGAWSDAGELTVADIGSSDGFGAAIAARGDRVAIGAPRQAPAGAVYVYERMSGGDWVQTGKLTPNMAP